MLTFWVLTKTGLFLIWELILLSFRSREHFTYHKDAVAPQYCYCSQYCFSWFPWLLLMVVVVLLRYTTLLTCCCCYWYGCCSYYYWLLPVLVLVLLLHLLCPVLSLSPWTSLSTCWSFSPLPWSWWQLSPSWWEVQGRHCHCPNGTCLACLTKALADDPCVLIFEITESKPDCNARTPLATPSPTTSSLIKLWFGGPIALLDDKRSRILSSPYSAPGCDKNWLIMQSNIFLDMFGDIAGEGGVDFIIFGIHIVETTFSHVVWM